MELERLAESFAELALKPGLKSEGLGQIAQGLQNLVRDVQAGDVSTDALEPLMEALSALESLVGGMSKTTPQAGLGRFVGAFIVEAQKRMAGLSLSINGIFDVENTDAVRLSAEHLHAIRGGAAMLGLKDIARLAGALEHCIISFGKSGDLATPTRPILRSFAVLKSALENPDQPLEALVDDVIEELEAAIDGLKKPPNPFHRVPTATDTRILEQRILVVDDVVTIASSIGFILSELDIPVDLANSGRQALEMLNRGGYSLVISDISMPDMDGYQLIEEMKSDPLLEDVPVILLTQLDTPAERARGMAAGANDYIVKGAIGGGELVARVSDLLIDAPYVPTRTRPERRSILIVEDTETIAASIAFVLSEGPFDIEIAHNGSDAFRLLSKRLFDLVLSDIEMPLMNGLELLKAMKSEPQWAKIPFVVLTSRSSGANAEEALRLGATRFMVKGDVPAEDLLKIVTEILDA